MDITTHMPGSFCTAVLRTRDVERAAAFYSALLGWTTQEVSGTSGHRLLQFRGKTVARLHQIAEGSDLWVPHVSVEGVERTTAVALALGATLMDTADVPGLARLATLRDPEGAQFGLWQPAPHQGAQLTEEVGSLWWIEVLSNDVAGAREPDWRACSAAPRSSGRASHLLPTRCSTAATSRRAASCRSGATGEYHQGGTRSS